MSPRRKSKVPALRISAPITREDLEFLEKLSAEARFSGGSKLSRADILRASLKAMQKMRIDVRGVNDEQELTRRIVGGRK